jgi:hypothetical protein
MKTLNRQTSLRSGAASPPLVRLPSTTEPYHARAPTRRRRYRVIAAIVAFAVAIAAAAAFANAYVDRGNEIDRLESDVAALEEQVGDLEATRTVLRATIGMQREARGRLVERIGILGERLETATAGREELAIRLGATEATLVAVRGRRADLARYLESLSTCSGAGMPALAPQAGLPDAVATMRADIGEAAVTCDLVRLHALAVRRGAAGFFYAWDTDLRPAAYWAVAEVRGEAPIRYLVGMLDLRYGTRLRDGRTTYVWPAAAAYDSWAEVPRVDREALRDWYGEEDFAVFREMGAYIGYRVAIRADGDWTTFIAGD